VLDMHRMDRIIEINTDSGYAVVEPGVLYDRLTSALKEAGFRMHVPTAPGSSTAVGSILSRSSGSLCNRHLDSVLDLEVVLPDGTVFNTGSSVWPTAGSSLRYGPFPDLAGLITCAYGTTGIVTRAAIRIYRINEANRVHLAAFDCFSDAVDFMKEIIDNNIPESCIIWNWQLYQTFAVDTSVPGTVIPPELRADPHKPPEGVPYCVVTSFLSGYKEVLEVYDKVLAGVAVRHNGKAMSDEEADRILPVAKMGWTELYARYHQIEPTFFGLGRYMAWIMFTEPRQVKELEKFAVDELSRLDVGPICYYSQPFDFGRSIFFRIFCFPDPSDQELLARTQNKYVEMWETAMQKYGAIPMRHKPLLPWLERTGGYADVLYRIKKALDPNNILNPAVSLFSKEDRL
jgi:FAD/FMN-containing dehydrogenase